MAYGQRKTTPVFLDSTTYIYHFSVTNKKPSVQNGRFYTWYKAGKILRTQSGYDGQLLNSRFTKNFLNKNLAEQGYYKLGKKKGIWKSWNENGLLSEVSRWHKGKLKGTFLQFDSAGKPMKQGFVKNEQFSGQIFYYETDSIRMIEYKKGKQVIPRNAGKDSIQSKNK